MHKIMCFPFTKFFNLLQIACVITIAYSVGTYYVFMNLCAVITILGTYQILQFQNTIHFKM